MPCLRLPRAKGALHTLVAMLLLGAGVVDSQAQTRATSEKVTSNLHPRVKLTRSVTGGSLNLFLAPELPSRVEREHWPIVFITQKSPSGEEVQVMQNLTEPETFALDIPNASSEVKVAGEDGLWTVDAHNSQIKGVELFTPSLRYLQLAHNEVSGTTAGVFEVPADLKALENLDLSYNKLTSLALTNAASTLKQVVANGNGLKEGDYSALSKLTYMNLQGNRLEKIMVPAAFVANQKVFDVSSLTSVSAADYKTSYSTDLANQLTYATVYDNKLFTNREGELNLSVNRLKISTLPKAPTGIQVGYLDKAVTAPAGDYKRPMYNVAAQERYEFAKTEYKLKEGIDLSSEISALDQNNGSHQTEINWYIEEDAGTDQYKKLDAANGDFEIVGGITKFKRGYGRDVKIFAELRNEAFENPLKNPTNPAGESIPAGLSSFEKRTGGGDAKNGYTFTTEQPSGSVHEVSETEAKDVGRFSFNGANVSIKSKVEDAKSSARNRVMYRTNVITLKGNYWYGFKDNNWADKENWTMRYVPLTTQTDYGTLTPASLSEANVEFASSDPAQYGESAIRDLHTDQDRVVEKYINKSATKKALVVQAAHQLLLKKGADVTVADAQDLLRVKAGDVSTANGTLIVEDQSSVKATVELFAQSSDQGTGLQRAKWQYFGAPVDGSYNTKKAVFGSALVRKYDRTLSITNSDEKWVALNDNDVIAPGAGYEVASPTPARFEFKGNVNYGNQSFGGDLGYEFNLDGVATGTNYNDINILANPFTAAMNIRKIQKGTNPANVVGTVYLFNTGSRENWLATNGSTTTGNAAGQYTAAIPLGLAGVSTLPEEIPSLSSFAVKANGSSSIYYLYSDLMKTSTANRARRKGADAPRVASLRVDVASEKSMDRLWLVEHEDATDGFDNGLDGEKMLSAGAAQLYAEGEQNLQVKTTKHLRRTNLSFLAADKAERYELKFHLEGFNAGDEFVLLDKRTGAETPINDGDKYSFIADAHDKPQRFAILRKGANIEDASESAFSVMADAARNIEVTNGTTESGNVLLVDATGKTVSRFTLAAGARKTVQVTLPGVYVVKAENPQSRLSQSVLVP